MGSLMIYLPSCKPVACEKWNTCWHAARRARVLGFLQQRLCQSHCFRVIISLDDLFEYIVTDGITDLL